MAGMSAASLVQKFTDYVPVFEVVNTTAGTVAGDGARRSAVATQAHGGNAVVLVSGVVNLQWQ